MTNEDIANGYYPLRPTQLWIVDTNLEKAKSTMMNIGALIKFDNGIDMQRIEEILNLIVNRHDIFRCRLVFHPDTNELCQRFDGEVAPINLEKISNEEFENLRGNLAQPRKLIDKPLWLIRLFETPNAKYGYFDFYHAIIDGTALALLIIHEVDRIYSGRIIKNNPPKYADYILEEIQTPPENLAEGREYWLNIFKKFDIKKHIPPPDIGEATWKGGYVGVPIKNISREYFADKAHKENIFFLAASMLAIAKSTGAKSSLMTWLHNGRFTSKERRLMGSLFDEYFIDWDFEEDCIVEEFLRGLEEKIAKGITYRKSLDVIYNGGLDNNIVNFIFQKNIYGDAKIGGLEVKLFDVYNEQYAATDNIISIEVNIEADGNYLLELNYDAGVYSEKAMENFAALIDEFVFKLQDDEKNISEILFNKC